MCRRLGEHESQPDASRSMNLKTSHDVTMERTKLYASETRRVLLGESNVYLRRR